MLILVRGVGERIIIGDDIVIQVMEIRGKRVKIGIEAPNTVPVHREEIYNAIQRAIEGDDDE